MIGVRLRGKHWIFIIWTRNISYTGYKENTLVPKGNERIEIIWLASI